MRNPFPDPPALVAEMILNHAVMKASYAAYDREAAERGRAV